MKKVMFLLIALTILGSVKAQEITENSDKTGYYLEDQLYLGIAYNMLLNKPASINSRGFSNSIFMGYIRDIPFNEKRNFGIGIGLGYGRETHYHNMKIALENNEVFYGDFNDVDEFSSNILALHSIEMPLEIRWRTSTLTKYKFFRVYAGVKFAYILHSKAEYILGDLQKITNFDGINKFQYGLNLAVGQGTVNFHAYYGFSSLFNDVRFNDDTPLNLKNIKLGLTFYML